MAKTAHVTNFSLEPSLSEDNCPDLVARFSNNMELRQPFTGELNDKYALYHTLIDMATRIVGSNDI